MKIIPYEKVKGATWDIIGETSASGVRTADPGNIHIQLLQDMRGELREMKNLLRSSYSSQSEGVRVLRLINKKTLVRKPRVKKCKSCGNLT